MAKPPVHDPARPAPPLPLVRDPLYSQLNERLTALVRSGQCPPGARFLTEREVAERFGVSRPTANKALSHLVVAGILELRKGIGTFVRPGALESDLRSLVSFTGHAQGRGRRPGTRVLSFATRPAREAPEEVRQALGVEDAERLYCMERLRLADGVPVILERRHLLQRRCPGLDRRRVAGSLYALLVDELGIEITGASQTITAVQLDAADARLLGTSAGAPALLVRAVGYAREPLWVERTLYRGDQYALVNAVGAPAGPPAPSRLVLAGPDGSSTVVPPRRSP